MTIFQKIVTLMIFIIVALLIYGVVQLGVDKGIDHICNDYAKSYQTCITETK